MQVFSSIKQLKPLLQPYKTTTTTLGFVPTMGALHQGHLSLVKKALDENDSVVVSIFVNPTQFNNKNDLKNYPRTLETDLKTLLRIATEKEIFVYTPNANEIYPNGLESEKYSFDGLENEMEGKYRSGHFDGVATVVNRFFTLIEPDKAYFGEKDFQQLQIIRKMTAIKNLPVAIVSCPISREPSGLAMSSRNKRLSQKEQEEAAFIYSVLSHVKKEFGTKSVLELSTWVAEQFQQHKVLELEYFQIADEATLKPLLDTTTNKTNARAFIAVYAGDVRLIDNIALN